MADGWWPGRPGAGKKHDAGHLLDRINQTRPCHMITIEDPIEYICTAPDGPWSISGRSGTDASAASTRPWWPRCGEDPDVILVGEIRDLNTIRTAIVAAETGHLVFTTVHAGDCVGAIERLVAVFPADEQDGIRRQLALVLRAIVAQHLLVADGPAGGPQRRGALGAQRRAPVPSGEAGWSRAKCSWSLRPWPT